MKKYIFTEGQIKRVIDNVVSEQTSLDEVTGNGLIHVKEAITVIDKAIKETEDALGHIAVNHE